MQHPSFPELFNGNNPIAKLIPVEIVVGNSSGMVGGHESPPPNAHEILFLIKESKKKNII